MRSLYDLLQGMWFIRTATPPPDPTRPGYRSFLEFCNVDDKTYIPDPQGCMWPLVAEEWICKQATVEFRDHGYDQDVLIYQVHSLRAESMAKRRELGL
jgi:hypothetical protein